jgi:hypothetical protein
MRPFNQGRHRRVDVFPQGIFSFSASMQAEIEARNNRELISSECAKPFHIPKGRAISFVVELDQCEYNTDLEDQETPCWQINASGGCKKCGIVSG